MTEPNFMTDGGFSTIKAMHLMRRVLQREWRVYQSELYKRCGAGLSAQQFDNIVKTLAEKQWCTLKLGAQGATLVILNPLIRAAGNVPEVEVASAARHNNRPI